MMILYFPTIICIDAGEIAWIEAVPLDTYRNEVLLLAQLKNSSILGLQWQMEGFQKLSLPSFGSDSIDLSKISSVLSSKFIYKNKIFKIGVNLEKLPMPVPLELKDIFETENQLAVSQIYKTNFLIQK